VLGLKTGRCSIIKKIITKNGAEIWLFENIIIKNELKHTLPGFKFQTHDLTAFATCHNLML